VLPFLDAFLNDAFRDDAAASSGDACTADTSSGDACDADTASGDACDADACLGDACDADTASGDVTATFRNDASNKDASVDDITNRAPSNCQVKTTQVLPRGAGLHLPGRLMEKSGFVRLR